MGRHLLRLPIVVVAALVCALAAAPACALAAAPAGAAGWVWPLAAPHRVVHGFAPPAHDWLAGHRGVDLAGSVRQPVVAAGAGRVVVAGSVAGVGVVAIAHADGLETTYEPVAPAVRAGTIVSTGTVVGHLVLAHSHCAPAPCLHWGLRRDGRYLDPLALVGAARVRLLPVLAGTGNGWVDPAVGSASAVSSAALTGWALTLRRRRKGAIAAPRP